MNKVSLLSPDPELLNLHLEQVELVAEEAVLLVKVVDSVAVLHSHLYAALYHLLPVNQLQPQCLSFCLQGLASALGLLQPGKMLEK